MKSPCSCIYIQQFQFSVAGVQLVFHFRQSVIVDLPQKAHGEFLHLRMIDGLDVGGGSPEFRWMLPPAARFHAADGLAILKKKARRKLIISVTGNDLLN